MSALSMQNFITRPNAPTLPGASHAQGIYVWSGDGRRYIDGSSGAVCNTLGHGNRRVIEAIRAQHEAVAFPYARAWTNAPDRGLAERIARLAGNGLDAAFFVSGGSEAVEACLKFARQLAVARSQSSRWKVIHRLPSYHGSTLGALSVTGDPVWHELFAPLLIRHPQVPAPLSYRVPEGYDVASYSRFCAAEVERTILAEGPDTVLAFIVEPIGGTATGALVAPDSYYTEIQRICKQYGVLLIYDEVMSGAGRSGPFLAAHHWPDVVPDIIALAKGLSSGYAPLGALVTRADLVEEVRATGGFAHGHTYAANPVSAAVGCAVLDELVERDLMRASAARGTELRQLLVELQSRCSLIGDVRGHGLHQAVEIVLDPCKRTMLPADTGGVERLREHCLAENLVLLTRRTGGGRFGEWLMVGPPLIIEPAELDELVRSFERGLVAFRDEIVRNHPHLLP